MEIYEKSTKSDFFYVIGRINEQYGKRIVKIRAWEKRERRHALKRYSPFKPWHKRKVAVRLGRETHRIVDSICKRLHPRRQNWTAADATTETFRDGLRITTSYDGPYSSRCRYSKYSYLPEVTSWAIVYTNLQKLAFKLLNNKLVVIKARRGYTLGQDCLGIWIAKNSSHHAEDRYHPNSADLAGGWPTLHAALEAHIATQKALRKERAEKTKQAKAQAKIDAKAQAKALAEREKLLSRFPVFCCYSDSIRAGNCHAGTEKWMKSAGILAGSHVEPERLMRLAKRLGFIQHVSRLIEVATERHLAELDHGFSIIQYHRRTQP